MFTLKRNPMFRLSHKRRHQHQQQHQQHKGKTSCSQNSNHDTRKWTWTAFVSTSPETKPDDNAKYQGPSAGPGSSTRSGSGPGSSHNTYINTYTFQLLLSLTNLNFLFTKLATLFNFAWETLAFAWVTQLIQPDQYHEQYISNCRAYQRYQTKTTGHRFGVFSYYNTYTCNNTNQSHFNPIPNVFERWSDHDHQVLKEKPLMMMRDAVNDDSSWGQFVEVD